MKPILEVFEGRRPDRTPIWLMRQAGRILPEYRALKERYSFLELMRDVELSTEVTMMPLRRFEELDAAILFTDLLVPLEALGVPLDYDPGPVLGWTFQDARDLDRFESLDVEDKLSVPLETARRVKQQLREDQALLGFVGAPWTLAAYLCEGQGSKSWAKLRSMAYGDPGLFSMLMERMVDAALRFGLALRDAGCDAIQVFDSWAGVAEPGMFRAQVGPHLQHLVGSLREAGIPVIAYANGAWPHLETMLGTGAEVLGLDWRVPMETFCGRLPEAQAVQGNLDPCTLFGTPGRIADETRRILDAAADRPHIFNLGHGFEPTTPLVGVEALLESVRAWDAERGPEAGA